MAGGRTSTPAHTLDGAQVGGGSHTPRATHSSCGRSFWDATMEVPLHRARRKTLRGRGETERHHAVSEAGETEKHHAVWEAGDRAAPRGVGGWRDCVAQRDVGGL